jgi:tripartite-type tricarboxylate transporter receptor subunit TctC
MEELAAREKIELVHVPYRASNESAVAVASGEVMSVADSSAWAPLVDGGQLAADLRLDRRAAPRASRTRRP